MKSILITGANRGVGLGIVKQLLLHSPSPELIFAGYRDVNRSQVTFRVFVKNIHRILL